MNFDVTQFSNEIEGKLDHIIDLLDPYRKKAVTTATYFHERIEDKFAYITNLLEAKSKKAK